MHCREGIAFGSAQRVPETYLIAHQHFGCVLHERLAPRGTLNGLAALLDALRCDLGDEFRFCVWPVGSVSGGSMTQVVRAQIAFSTGPGSFALGVEPGQQVRGTLFGSEPPSERRSKCVMGRRGVLNAASYFLAKANDALSVPHYGAGPQIVAYGVTPTTASWSTCG